MATQTLRLDNLSSIPRTNQWARFTIPRAAGVQLHQRGTFHSAEGIQLPVVAGHFQGDQQIVHARTTCGPAASLEGAIVWASHWVDSPFHLSDWVAHSRLAFVELEITLEDGTTNLLTVGSLRAVREFVEESNIVRVLHLRGKVPGTQEWCDLWLYIYTNQDIVPFELALNCSDQSTTALEERVVRVALRTGEFPRMWTALRRGASQPRPLPGGIGWETVLFENKALPDGVMPSWFGSFLVGPPRGDAIASADVPSDELQLRAELTPGVGALVDGLPEVARLPLAAPWIDQQQRLANLNAEMQGPIVAMVSPDDWDGHWGPLGVVPKRPPGWSLERARQDVVERIGRGFIATTSFQGDLFDSVPLGCLLVPANAGDQHGFGNAKMGPAFGAFEPAYLFVAAYSALHGLGCRPIHYREPDGTLVTPWNYNPKLKPGSNLLTFWDCRTHFNFTVSPERLGKTDESKRFHSQWAGFDNQHFEPLLEVSYAALTGSHLARFQLQSLAEKWFGQQNLPSQLPRPDWPGAGMDHARALGRTLFAGLWLHCILGDDRLLRRCIDRVNETAIFEPGDGPVRAFSVHRNEPRVLDGLYPGFFVPFEAFAVRGLAATWMRAQKFGFDATRCLQLGYELARSLTLHCVTWIDERVVVPWQVRWLEGGQPLEPHVFLDPTQVRLGGGEWEWWAYCAFALAPRLAAAAVHAGFATEAEAKLVTERAEAISASIRQHHSGGGEENRWRAQEWFAV